MILNLKNFFANITILLTFENKEKRLFDMKPWANYQALSLRTTAK